MEGRFKTLLLFGTFFIIVDVTQQAGFTYYIRKYILIINSERSWPEAQSYCRAEYGDLATIPGGQETSLISDMAVDLDVTFWIGLYDDVSGWKWSLVGEHFYAGVGEDYRRWQGGQPDNTGGVEHCVSMMEDGLWRDNSCTLIRMPLICFRDGAVDQYVLVTEEKSWFEAQSYCRQHHTDLVSVRSPAENQEVSSRLQGNQSVQEAWIGLHRDSWKWSDGSSSSFRHWWGEEPDNENGSQACAAMHKGAWNDSKCDTRFSFLCQKITEVIPTAPTTIRQVAQRRTTVKVKLLTNSDLTDSTIRQEVLQQFEAAFHLQGFTDIKLVWRTLRAEPQPTERDARGEEMK